MSGINYEETPSRYFTPLTSMRRSPRREVSTPEEVVNGGGGPVAAERQLSLVVNVANNMEGGGGSPVQEDWRQAEPEPERMAVNEPPQVDAQTPMARRALPRVGQSGQVSIPASRRSTSPVKIAFGTRVPLACLPPRSSVVQLRPGEKPTINWSGNPKGAIPGLRVYPSPSNSSPPFRRSTIPYTPNVLRRLPRSRSRQGRDQTAQGGSRDGLRLPRSRLGSQDSN